MISEPEYRLVCIFLKLRAMAGEMLRFYFTGEMAPHIYAEFYFVRAH